MDNVSQSPTASGGANPPAAAPPPDLTGRTLGEFKVLAPLPLSLVLGLVPRHGAELARDHAP